MVNIRPFRNDDPPALVKLWNEARLSDDAYPQVSANALERCALAKPYFQPTELLVAEEAGNVVGFVHVGFGPNSNETALDQSSAVVCAIIVAKSMRRRGIGSQLLDKAEEFLTSKGVELIFAGQHWPLCPYYFGLYGGSELPGFLSSHADAEPFFMKKGYHRHQTQLILRRSLDNRTTPKAPVFSNQHHQYQVSLAANSTGSWWYECVIGLVEPVRFQLVQSKSGESVARATLWDMYGFGPGRGASRVGLGGIHVRADLRRQGLAKFLLNQISFALQEQSYETVEMQLSSEDAAGQALLRSLGFQEVDRGVTYRRENGK